MSRSKLESLRARIRISHDKNHILIYTTTFLFKTDSFLCWILSSGSVLSFKTCAGGQQRRRLDNRPQRRWSLKISSNCSGFAKDGANSRASDVASYHQWSVIHRQSWSEATPVFTFTWLRSRLSKLMANQIKVDYLSWKHRLLLVLYKLKHFFFLPQLLIFCYQEKCLHSELF